MSTRQIKYLVLVSGVAVIALIFLFVASREGLVVEPGAEQDNPLEQSERSRKQNQPEQKHEPSTKVALENFTKVTSKKAQGSAVSHEADIVDSISGAREAAVEKWDELVDGIVELEGELSDDRCLQLKRAFNKIQEGDKRDAIRYSLNLIPDDKFVAVVSILFDKSQPEEILNLIFSDALNRDEEVKVPLMREIRKDKTHPMFFESARILDVIDVD